MVRPYRIVQREALVASTPVVADSGLLVDDESFESDGFETGGERETVVPSTNCNRGGPQWMSV